MYASNEWLLKEMMQRERGRVNECENEREEWWNVCCIPAYTVPNLSVCIETHALWLRTYAYVHVHSVC